MRCIEEVSQSGDLIRLDPSFPLHDRMIDFAILIDYLRSNHPRASSRSLLSRGICSAFSYSTVLSHTEELPIVHLIDRALDSMRRFALVTSSTAIATIAIVRDTAILPTTRAESSVSIVNSVDAFSSHPLKVVAHTHF